MVAAMNLDPQSRTARPEWTYSVQAPQILSPLWMLQVLSWLGIPIAIVSLIAAANYLGWVEFN